MRWPTKQNWSGLVAATGMDEIFPAGIRNLSFVSFQWRTIFCYKGGEKKKVLEENEWSTKLVKFKKEMGRNKFCYQPWSIATIIRSKIEIFNAVGLSTATPNNWDESCWLTKSMRLLVDFQRSFVMDVRGTIVSRFSGAAAATKRNRDWNFHRRGNFNDIIKRMVRLREFSLTEKINATPTSGRLSNGHSS